jgi:hypothetical protein
MKSSLMSPRTALLAAGAVLATAASFAQDPPPAPELPPRYVVEVLVFANRNLDPTEERFDRSQNSLGSAPLEALREAPVFDDTNFGPLAANPPQTSATAPTLEPDPLTEALRVRLLRPDELELGQLYRRLGAIDAYQPLLHTGWVQPGLAEADGRPFDLGQVGALNPHGTVHVFLSRFLHVTLDLTFEGQPAAVDPAAPNAAASPGDGLAEVVLAPRYHLAATRNVRSGELHYFDHPAFGVLVRVTPVPTEDTAESGRRPAA